jgi:alkanesulfonate monooxygenase SsuD/methylene tetrahydromethanopterin reductase-like flavin-dependent oxidoreductase (luciferase family)
VKFYHFTEMPYPFLPEDYADRYGSIRVSLPNTLYDPKIGYDLYQRYLDEHQYADELGFNLMVNEHHQTATCLDVSLAVSASALIQRTRGSNSRILLLGHPLPHRNDPLRVAEETAMLDVMSGGRIECGFVRGVPTEIHPANTNPTKTVERFREAHDLILKCWRSQDIFNWEGKHFQYRYVNVWPRPYQQPHPPIWVTGGTSPENAAWVAEQQHNFAMFLTPYEITERLMAAYRDRIHELGHPEPGADRFGYLALCYTAETDEKANEEGRELLWYLRGKVAPYFTNVPGFSPVSKATVGTKGAIKAAEWEDLLHHGVVIAGGPDTVRRKVRYLYERCGIANLMMMNQAGFLSHDRVMKSLRLFAQEVMPELAELGERQAA